jgi:hypothetical protein
MNDILVLDPSDRTRYRGCPMWGRFSGGHPSRSARGWVVHVDLGVRPGFPGAGARSLGPLKLRYVVKSTLARCAHSPDCARLAFSIHLMNKTSSDYFFHGAVTQVEHSPFKKRARKILGLRRTSRYAVAYAPTLNWVATAAPPRSYLFPEVQPGNGVLFSRLFFCKKCLRRLSRF